MMAATYGYGGEFSSDEDIDRMEQQAERLVQSKFDSYTGQSNKPSRQTIEEAIVAIRSMPADQDVILPDEILAGLLDYYKTQRGPIVDSTRNLYKKIILKTIRGSGSVNGDKTSNGDSNGNNNNNNNNNELNVASKRQQMVEIAASSDEDEPMPPASSEESSAESQQQEQATANKRKFDSRVVYNDDRLEPMEVDSETPAGGIRTSKNVDISSSSENDATSDEDDDGDEGVTDEESSDSEELDVTPIKERKPQQQQVQQKSAAAGTKSSDMVKKVNLPSSNKDDISAEAKKKPYTRSQRVAATRASSSSTKKTDVSSSRVETTDVVRNKTLGLRVQNLPMKLLVSAVIFVLVAALLYHFRSDLSKSSERILSKAIKF